MNNLFSTIFFIFSFFCYRLVYFLLFIPYILYVNIYIVTFVIDFISIIFPSFSPIYIFIYRKHLRYVTYIINWQCIKFLLCPVFYTYMYMYIDWWFHFSSCYTFWIIEMSIIETFFCVYLFLYISLFVLYPCVSCVC